MGEPMCRNLALKGNDKVLAYDLDPAPLARLAADGVAAAGSPAVLCGEAHTILLSLPDGEKVRQICLGEEGLLAHLTAGQCVIDAGTSPPQLARELHQAFGVKGVAFADAPVAIAPTICDAGIPLRKRHLIFSNSKRLAQRYTVHWPLRAAASVLAVRRTHHEFTSWHHHHHWTFRTVSKCLTRTVPSPLLSEPIFKHIANTSTGKRNLIPLAVFRSAHHFYFISAV